MPVLFDCPSCNRPLRVPESATGKMMQCPLCQDSFRVPVPAVPPQDEVVVLEEVAEPAPAAPRRPAPRPVPRPRPADEEDERPGWDEPPPVRAQSGLGLGPALLIGGAVALLFLTAGGVALWLAFGGDGAPDSGSQPARPDAVGTGPSANFLPPMGHQPAPPGLFPGLVGYWAFDEAAGPRVADGSGNGADGTAHGGRRVPGIRGNALLLDGVSEYFDYGTSPRFNFPAGGPFTFAGWVRTTAGNGHIVSQRSSTDGGPVIEVRVSGGNIAALVRQDRGEMGPQTRVTGNRVNDGQWHHFALVRDAVGIELFLDGFSQGKVPGVNALGPVTTDLRALGSERYWVTTNQRLGPAYLAAAVDEFCVFNRALTPLEVRSLAGR